MSGVALALPRAYYARLCDAEITTNANAVNDHPNISIALEWIRGHSMFGAPEVYSGLQLSHPELPPLAMPVPVVKRRRVPKVETEDIRYASVQDPSSGWPAMVKTVREADINKIDDCKEDIDTLLVFAGLYSAVLSAFIIESYRTLQQDSQDVMVGLMRQLVAQNFTSGPGFLNSTTPAPEIPDFEPPLWAIRVNVLWFVSLILSLSAASFGMLVKQWLREYLAFEYTAPQQRLRARQYRSPALSKWKVFEIAALLPVLLQISLGLFFVGLCFFTSAIHSSVRSCTIPVVCAWAFFLLMTTVAPLFSPRCPFKTTFLKNALKIGRRYLAPICRHSIRFVSQAFYYIMRNTRPGQKLRTALALSRSTIFTTLRWSYVPFQLSYRALHAVWASTVGSRWERVCGFRYDPSGIEEDLTEEQDLVTKEQEDAEILGSIDAFMSDDDLLPVLLDTVQQQMNPILTVSFVLQCIARRLGLELPTQNLTSILELNSLSKRAWSVTTDAIATTLRRHSPLSMRADSLPWVYDAVIILLSHSPYALSQLAVGALRDIIAHEESNCIRLGKRLAGNGTTSNPFLGLSRQLRRLSEVADGAVAPLPLMQIYIGLLCSDHSHISILRLLHEHPLEVLRSSSAGILNDLFDFIAFVGTWLVSRGPRLGTLELVQIMLQHGDKFGKLDDAIGLCSQLLLHRFHGIWVVFSFAALHPKRRVNAEQEHVLLDAYLSSGNSDQDRDRMISNMTSILLDFCNGVFDDPARWEPIDVVRLCRLQLKIYFAAKYRNEGVWRALWTQCASAISRYHEISGWEGKAKDYNWLPDSPLLTPDELLRVDEGLACECLTIIMSHSESYTPVVTHVPVRFPAALIAALWRFATPEVKQRFKWLRQTLQLPMGGSSEAKEENAEGEDEDGERESHNVAREDGKDEGREGGKKNADGRENRKDLEEIESGARGRKVIEADENE